MKNINTLISDIENLFTYAKPEETRGTAVLTAEPKKVNEENLEKFSCNVAGLVKKAIEEASKPSAEHERASLRMSKLGTPDRKLWYEVNDPSSQRSNIDAATAVKFLYGHILEELVLLLVKEAGHTVEGEQEEVVIDGVLGHRDCKIDGVVVDVKSASKFAFQKFADGSVLRGDDPFGYVAQISAYSTPENGAAEDAAFLVINKESGEITLLKVPTMDMINPLQRIRQIKENVLPRTTPPETKCYEPVDDGKEGNKVLNRNCTFCRYKFKCWEGQLRAFSYSTGPKYFTQVLKTPRVDEIPLT